jgi:hypothetical protein
MVVITMEIVKKFSRSQYLIPLIPAVAVLIDYSLTFFLADNRAMILQWEASPLLKFATSNDLILLYIASIMLFYYFGTLFVLKLLSDSNVYPIAVCLVLILSATHVLGGLSWYFRNPWYSNTIYTVSIISIVVAIALFGYVAIRNPDRYPRSGEA